MKIHFAIKPKKPVRLESAAASKPKRKSPLDNAKLFSFWLPSDEREDLDTFITKAKASKLTYTRAYIVREGVKLFMQQQQKLLNQALAGTLNAKKRTVIK